MEVALVIAISAVLGILWNRTLLADAWRGNAPKQAAAAPKAELLPMPIGLLQVKEMHDAKAVVLVDARSAGSFANEHIAGAVSLPLEEARKRAGRPLLEKVSPDAVIAVYCSGFSCHDSVDLGKLLIEGGYRNVYVFEGGLPEWRDAGFPVSGGAR